MDAVSVRLISGGVLNNENQKLDTKIMAIFQDQGVAGLATQSFGSRRKLGSFLIPVYLIITSPTLKMNI